MNNTTPDDAQPDWEMDLFGKMTRHRVLWLRENKFEKSLCRDIIDEIFTMRRKTHKNEKFNDYDDLELKVTSFSDLSVKLGFTSSNRGKVQKAVNYLDKNRMIFVRTEGKIRFLKINKNFKYGADSL